MELYIRETGGTLEDYFILIDHTNNGNIKVVDYLANKAFGDIDLTNITKLTIIGYKKEHVDIIPIMSLTNIHVRYVYNFFY